MAETRREPYRKARKRCSLCGKPVHSWTGVKDAICRECEREAGSRRRALKVARGEARP